MAHDYTETNREDNRQDSATGIQRKSASDDVDADALLEYGEVLYENHLAKNAKDRCPICLREFNGELVRSYCVVLPCGEHALCASCLCSLKIQADKAKQCPQCPLCRFLFNCDFVEGSSLICSHFSQRLESFLQTITNSICEWGRIRTEDHHWYGIKPSNKRRTTQRLWLYWQAPHDTQLFILSDEARRYMQWWCNWAKSMEHCCLGQDELLLGWYC